MDIRGYYFITDTALTKAGNTADVAAAVAAGAKAVQYRAKNLSTRSMIEEAFRLKRTAKNTLFIVNDRVDVALAVDAGGVHLGQDDMLCQHARRLLGPGAIIGVTAHSVDQALDAQAQGADYIGVAPIFATSTKHDAGTPAGVRLITEIKQAVRIPVVAIGGITLANAPQVIAAGADAVCAISAVVMADDVEERVREFQKLYT
ncbi:MAG: thiamine phosphate synthase [Elusimicrobia bacterium]|nr:thiamine phosphate synthase [Elusimicrobiota bacterium]